MRGEKEGEKEKEEMVEALQGEWKASLACNSRCRPFNMQQGGCGR